MTQGVQPVANATGGNPDYSVWTVNGYTVLDLSHLGFAAPFSNPLLLTIRSTLPDSHFRCSGSAVPFSTAEYTNLVVNGAATGSGLMGPYAPLVDYVNPNTLPAAAPTQIPLPALKYCGILPPTPPNLNTPALSPNNDCTSSGQFCVDFPNQYWPSNTTHHSSPNLNCPDTKPDQPPTAIYFVATQFPTPALTHALDTGDSCNTTQQPNPCNQIVVQGTQNTELPGGVAWQAPLPLTIVGSGFGTLAQLPYAGPANSLPGTSGSPLLTIADDGNSSGGTTAWNTNGSACQMYIADWRDSSISLIANLPVNVHDSYQQAYLLPAVLSPLWDYSPLTFSAAAGCPVSYNTSTGKGDNLTIAVTNPQTGNQSIIQVTVSPANSVLF